MILCYTQIIAAYVYTYICINTTARVKTKLKNMKGVRRNMLSSYLDEFMWRERHGRTSGGAFHNMLIQIANKHPLP